MDHASFCFLYQEFRPGARKIKAPAMEAVWRPVVEGKTKAEVENALREWFQGNALDPKPNDLQKILRAQSRPTNPSPEVEYVDITLVCRGCHVEIRQGVKGDPDGGLVFRKHEGVIYAARCPMCKGPAWARTPGSKHYLPEPDIDAFEEGKWLPVDMTSGKLKLEADMMTKTYNPDKSSYWAWLKPILQASREKMNADQAAATAPE